MDGQLKVLMVAAEAVPFAKVGGLAEFAGALPKALRQLGVDVRLMIPRYSDGVRTGVPQLRRVGKTLPIPAGSGEEPAHLFWAEVDGVPVYLIYNDQHFGNRARVYGFNDDPQRFMFFSRAVISAMRTLDWVPDVVHANDWHTAPIPTWLDVYGGQDNLFRDIASLYTVHNFAYQGIAGRLLLNYGRMMAVPHLSVEPPGKINWTAQGIAHADVVNTVSPSYAREVLSGTSGDVGALEPLLARKRDRFFGILSGIDTASWDPETDDALTQTFGAESLAMRAVNKTALQRELHLPADGDLPLLGLVSRLVPAKGLELLAESLEDLLASLDCQFVLLGTGDPELAAMYHALQSRYARSVRAVVRFDDRLARRIFAGVDLYVMPSRHESVSVALMSAMHYGAVPVVRAVGGLVDAVTDVTGQPDRGTGFSFVDFTKSALLGALRRALALFSDKRKWHEIQRRGMSRDFSWESSARAYVDLYHRAQRVRK
ncbi:MAG: glycogen synthase [Anaerolineae bacterium]|nr:glycogen synthase [Anaerolineae bacterium]